MDDFDIETLVENTSSESIQVWLPTQKSNKKIDSIRVDDKQAFKLYQAGHSLYCRAPQELEHALVPSLLQSLGYGVRPQGNDRYSRGEIEMFFSRQGHVTDFHCDFQENFTIQLSGSKKWIFCESNLNHPLRGVTPHFDVVEDLSLPEQQLKVVNKTLFGVFTDILFAVSM
jgi:hypothetical protein